MRFFTHLAVLFLTAWTVGQASATTYDPLTITGTFSDQFSGQFTLSGSLGVDTSSGLIVDASLNWSANPGHTSSRKLHPEVSTTSASKHPYSILAVRHLPQPPDVTTL